jgi:GNAT superfamily N-acetyltransferase
VFKPLSGECRIEAFSCGDAEIDKWFRNKSASDHIALRSRVTTVRLEESGDPVGFYSICLSLEDEGFLDKAKYTSIRNRSMKKLFPSLQFQWIGVQKEHQNKGIGRIMIGRVISVFIDSVLNIGVPVMTLVARNTRVADFYQRLGFVSYGGNGSTRMLLPAQSALDLGSSLMHTENNA